MLEAKEMKVLRKTVGKTKTDRIRSQQIRESCGIQIMNVWVQRIRTEWDEHKTRLDAERSVKISTCRKKIFRMSDRKMKRLYPGINRRNRLQQRSGIKLKR